MGRSVHVLIRSTDVVGPTFTPNVCIECWYNILRSTSVKLIVESQAEFRWSESVKKGVSSWWTVGYCNKKQAYSSFLAVVLVKGMELTFKYESS